MPNFDGLFTAILILGAILGAVAFALLFVFLPWVWELIKPWLHAVTG